VRQGRRRIALFVQLIPRDQLELFRVGLEYDGRAVLIGHVAAAFGQHDRAPMAGARGSVGPHFLARRDFETADRARPGVGHVDVAVYDHARADALRAARLAPEPIRFGDVAAAAQLERHARAVVAAERNANALADHRRRIGQVALVAAQPLATPKNLAVIRIVGDDARRQAANRLVAAVELHDNRRAPRAHWRPVGALAAVAIGRLVDAPQLAPVAQ